QALELQVFFFHVGSEVDQFQPVLVVDLIQLSDLILVELEFLGDIGVLPPFAHFAAKEDAVEATWSRGRNADRAGFRRSRLSGPRLAMQSHRKKHNNRQQQEVSFHFDSPWKCDLSRLAPRRLPECLPRARRPARAIPARCSEPRAPRPAVVPGQDPTGLAVGGGFSPHSTAGQQTISKSQALPTRSQSHSDARLRAPQSGSGWPLVAVARKSGAAHLPRAQLRGDPARLVLEGCIRPGRAGIARGVPQVRQGGPACSRILCRPNAFLLPLLLLQSLPNCSNRPEQVPFDAADTKAQYAGYLG